MQIWHFTAAVVAIEQLADEHLLILGLADKTDEPDEYLTIQRSFDEANFEYQDSDLDGYCVCLPNGATDYRCIERWELELGRLHIHFNQSAQAVFQLVGVDVKLAIDSDQHQQLHQALQQLLN
ncbi:Imm10 family immunity protein [Herpetosiphon gulosus]|uniref:Uncharacterized protein n=1 Tax=Herpetosiphon gulosus TaxID=1973496 RepID=A0ABP9X5I5_9CHLR